EQQRREHIIFRSFLTGEEKKGSLMAPVQRRPGLRQAGSAGFGCLAKGSEVQLENLSRRELNGLKGTVVTDKPDEFGRIYVDIGGGKSFRVLKISPDRLKRAGESETRPAWMPAGRQGLEEMGASHWSASGIRTGFPGFGILQSKQWQSTPELREKLLDIFFRREVASSSGWCVVSAVQGIHSVANGKWRLLAKFACQPGT
ncbi:unnamed protein product, partial [Effrenium voratum]